MGQVAEGQEHGISIHFQILVEEVKWLISEQQCKMQLWSTNHTGQENQFLNIFWKTSKLSPFLHTGVKPLGIYSKKSNKPKSFYFLSELIGRKCQSKSFPAHRVLGLLESVLNFQGISSQWHQLRTTGRGPKSWCLNSLGSMVDWELLSLSISGSLSLKLFSSGPSHHRLLFPSLIYFWPPHCFFHGS